MSASTLFTLQLNSNFITSVHSRRFSEHNSERDELRGALTLRLAVFVSLQLAWLPSSKLSCPDSLVERAFSFPGQLGLGRRQEHGLGSSLRSVE